MLSADHERSWLPIPSHSVCSIRICHSPGPWRVTGERFAVAGGLNHSRNDPDVRVLTDGQGRDRAERPTLCRTTVTSWTRPRSPGSRSFYKAPAMRTAWAIRHNSRDEPLAQVARDTG